MPGKILEKVVNEQVKKFVEENNLYSKNQYGFRNRLSTADAVEKVVGTITKNQNEGKHTTATFLDLKKAFDVVNHDILIMKLESQYNFDPKTVSWFKNYLSNRKQYTRINGKCSELQRITCGVPQGSILRRYILKTYRVRSDNYKRSFDFVSRIYWNSLDKEVHQLMDKTMFNSYVKPNLDKLYNKVVK